MHYASDNTGPVHPRVMEALMQANAGYTPSYGAADLDARAVQLIRDVFEAPQAAVFLVATGTAANALLLSALCQPFQTVFCCDVSHIHEDECNAPEFYTGGAKLTLIPETDGKLTAEALRAAMAPLGSVHGPQPGPISITQASEKGTLYSLTDIAEIAEIAKGYGVPLHMDGARFANACAALGCSAAQMSWKSGVDAVSFGGTKNGLMGVEAMVIFDPAKAWELELRRKRAAHLFSKHRFLAAQMVAYLEGDLWLDMAAQANTACAALARGLRQVPQMSLAYEPQVNMIFADFPQSLHARLEAGGAAYAKWGAPAPGQEDPIIRARMVCDWSSSDADRESFLSLLSDPA